MGARAPMSWPAGHGAWFFSERGEYEAGATWFLAEGVARREQVWFVAEDPGRARWPRPLLDSGNLVLAEPRTVYEPLRDGDLEAQRRVFATAVTKALGAGFTGIRVVADNTRLVNDRPDCWVEWESVVDEFITGSPVTGLCAFDRSLLSLHGIQSLVHLHPVAVGA